MSKFTRRFKKNKKNKSLKRGGAEKSEPEKDEREGVIDIVENKVADIASSAATTLTDVGLRIIGLERVNKTDEDNDATKKVDENINKVSDKLSIQQMVIQESGISVNGVRSICEILMNPKISNVTFLDLSNNDTGAEGLTILSNYPLVTLTKLCLSNCNIICDTEVIGNNIRNLFNSYCNIESIDISHNKLTCMAVPFIINVANCHVKLREVKLSFNKIIPKRKNAIINAPK